MKTAIQNAGLKDGATLSFHHHLRNGDDVMRQVLSACQALGLKGLHIAPSSVFPCHGALVDFLKDGTVRKITTSYMNGPLADAVKAGHLQEPAVLQTHGGRAAAIESGRLRIDAAFIAAPAADFEGNLTGAIGPQACGPLGYAMVDAACADHVIAVTDFVTKTLPRICIPATQVDVVVKVDKIGDASQIVSGTTGRPPSKRGAQIAQTAARLIAASGLLRDGFSFQTGAGATSLAVAQALVPEMTAKAIVGDFAAGGITGPLVKMFRAGLFRRLWDVQAFDLEAVQSYCEDMAHHPMSASLYASPDRKDAITNQLDVMILGAAEVDTQFNVNVTQASDGRIIGGSGGHADTAETAKLAIVTTTLTAGGFPKIVDKVRCLTTSGATIGAVVTEAGIAIHETRPELRDQAIGAGLEVVSLEDMASKARMLCAVDPSAPPFLPSTGRVVIVCEDRRGNVIDHIHA